MRSHSRVFGRDEVRRSRQNCIQLPEAAVAGLAGVVAGALRAKDLWAVEPPPLLSFLPHLFSGFSEKQKSKKENFSFSVRDPPKQQKKKSLSSEFQRPRRSRGFRLTKTVRRLL